MENQNLKKLTLKKEPISNLTDENMNQLVGGRSITSAFWCWNLTWCQNGQGCCKELEPCCEGKTSLWQWSVDIYAPMPAGQCCDAEPGIEP